MADYFTNFSLILKLPSEAALKYALDVADQARKANFEDKDDLPADFPESIRDAVEDWNFEAEVQSRDGLELWLHSSSGGIDAVCAFIQDMLQKFDPQRCVCFEWSNDCSKPRVDAYGGGAAIITAERIKSMNTGEWLQKHTPAPAL